MSREAGPYSLAGVTVAVGEALTLEDVVAVADGAPVDVPAGARATACSPPAPSSSGPCPSGATIYGVTTGFGSLADVRIDPSQAAELQHGIVRSHATAVGRPLSREEARAMLLLRAHVLALGYSGVRPEVIDLMVEMLNQDVIPAVPEQGSLGASGDLAPLANLALPLIGHGEVLSPEGGVEAAGAGDGARGTRAAARWRPRKGSPSSTARRACSPSASSPPTASRDSRARPTSSPP